MSLGCIVIHPVAVSFTAMLWRMRARNFVHESDQTLDEELWEFATGAIAGIRILSSIFISSDFRLRRTSSLSDSDADSWTVHSMDWRATNIYFMSVRTLSIGRLPLPVPLSASMVRVSFIIFTHERKLNAYGSTSNQIIGGNQKEEEIFIAFVVLSRHVRTLLP